MAVALRADRASFGGALTPLTTPLRLGALPAATAGALRLALDASGNVTAGVLGTGDIPSAFTRRDVAETISQDWTWGTGHLVAFTGGAGGTPIASGRSVGTRLVINSWPGMTENALGQSLTGMWTSVAPGQRQEWYYSDVLRMHLDTAGTLSVVNGSGKLLLMAAGSSDGFIDAGMNLRLTAAGAIELSTNAGIMPVAGYRENLGSLQKKYLQLHAAELWVETLVAQQTMATIGGRIVVAPTTTLTRDVAVGDTTIYVKDNLFGLVQPTVEFGSKILLQVAGQTEVMGINTSSPPTITAQGDYPYPVIRGGGGFPASGTAYAWSAGTAVLDTGKVNAATATPGGFIDLYSVSGVNPGSTAGPTIVGNVRVDHDAFSWAPRWAVGNLKGLYGNGATLYGTVFGDYGGAHLQIDATNGIRMLGPANSPIYGHWRPDGTITLGDTSKSALSFIPTEGSFNLQYNGAYKMRLKSDGWMYLHTGLVVGETGSSGIVCSGGMTSWGSGSGFYLGGYPTYGLAMIGTAGVGGRRLEWDGASLRVISDGFTIDENGITLKQGTLSEYSKQVRWITSGSVQVGTLWDSGANNTFNVYRGSGVVNIQQNDSGGSAGNYVQMYSGGSGTNQTYLRAYATSVELGGFLTAGTYPPFYPQMDWSIGLYNMGSATRRWGFSWFCAVSIQQASGAGVSYNLQLGADVAAKPSTGTWIISPSDRRAKRNIRPVNIERALATVRQVPLVDYTYNGLLGSTEGESGIGVIADDVIKLLPRSVRRAALAGATPEPDAPFGWNPHELLMLNVAAVQALAKRLDRLERKH